MGNPVQQMEWLENGIALIPIAGPLVKDAQPSEKYYYGVSSYEDIKADIDDAVSGGASAIGLLFKSPGGMVTGSTEAAEKIAELRDSGFPIYAYTEDVLASAAYKMAVGSAGIFASPSAVVGSIGTIWETVSVAEALKQMGIDWRVFTSGKYKGMGHQARELSDAQAEFMQSEVMRMNVEFTDFVKSCRDLSDEYMQGQFFNGTEALRVGMIDRVMSSREQFIGYLETVS
jgi:protease-4